VNWQEQELFLKLFTRTRLQVHVFSFLKISELEPVTVPFVSMSKKDYFNCLVLVGSRNIFDRWFNKRNCFDHNQANIVYSY